MWGTKRERRDSMALTYDAFLFADLSFVTSAAFLWKTAIIVAVSSLPLYVIKFVRQRLAPPSYSKLNMT